MIAFPRLLLGLFLVVAMPAAMAAAQDKAPAQKVVVQVSENDPKTMNLALNNVQNLIAYYKEKGETVQVEIVSFGPGLHMLREDTSPVKDRISTLAMSDPEIQFSACNNTLNGMAKQEGKTPPLISEAKLIPSGVVRIVELQKEGYAYLKP